MDASRTVTSNNGDSIPVLGAYISLLLAYDADCLGAGFGVWDPKVQHGVDTELSKHFDATLIYGTQEPLGEAIRRSGVPRKQFFICTKFPWNLHGRIGGSLNESLEIPGVDYVDLFLMRWAQYVVYEKDNFLPKNTDRIAGVTEERNSNQSWEAMEKLLETGKCKAVGITNFSIKTFFAFLQIDLPANKLHPYLVQEELVQHCRAKSIVVVAYTPTGLDGVRKDPVIIELAEKYNTTSRQVILARHRVRGVAGVPKCVDEGRQKGNRTLPVLEPEDVKRISGLDKNDRLCNEVMEVNGTLWGWTYEQLGWA
ncbi:reductase AKOR2 [Armillaria luteobubalina]|uniref:Reductase AKOR2 n=1 Tax=Armillaria luteobubalina TaxID=153913 RepID=A0AA39UWM5_9AGAR|nr:reductase AKOR2 [Armillaria luteobubalina]